MPQYKLLRKTDEGLKKICRLYEDRLIDIYRELRQRALKGELNENAKQS